MSRKLVTQKEIAEHLGVSIATVSRTLNDQPGVGAEIRARILQTARDMGYSSKLSVRGSTSAAARTVGYVSYKHGDVLPSNLAFGSVTPAPLEGVDAELRRCGYHMLTTYVDKEIVRGLKMPTMVQEGRVEGVIVGGPAISQDFILLLRSTGLPIVLTDNVLSDIPIDCILCDNEGGAYQAARHLIDHGHKRITFLSGPAHWLSSRERTAGYRRALLEEGLDPHIVFMSNTIFTTGHKAMLTALRDHSDLTAVMGVNDATAVGAVQACQQMGRDVPNDIAVVGFDDVPWAQIHVPPLTTVRVHWHEIGAQAARRAVNLIERDNQVPIEMRLSVELIIRQSCGCPTK